MGYIVLSKKQVAGNNINGSLNVKLCKDKASANLQRKQLHEKNYDVVILDKTDCDLLSKSTFKDWVYGGYNNPDPIWNGPSEDLLVNSSEGDDMNSDKHNDEHTGEDNLYPELTLSQAKDLVGHNFGWGGDEEDNDGGDDTNSDKHNEIYKHNYGGDEEAHKAWDKEGEGKVIEHDVVILSKGDYKLVASKFFKAWVKEEFDEEDDRYEVDGSSVGDGKYEDEESELQKFELEPEDLDNPDEDLVIIGSGYLDIKSKFGERPPQTNGEYAEIGQKVVDKLHNGDKEAALDYIYSMINENEEEDGGVSYSEAHPVDKLQGTDDKDKKTYFRFLNGLRDSGQTNMFGAGPYLETYFDLSKREAREILTAWMKSFDSIDENLSDEEIEHHIKMAKLGGGDEKSLRKIAKLGKDDLREGFRMSQNPTYGNNFKNSKSEDSGLTGYDDPKYPKSKHHKANNEMIEFAKALGKADVKKDTMEEMFHKMGTRLAQKFGK